MCISSNDIFEKLGSKQSKMNRKANRFQNLHPIKKLEHSPWGVFGDTYAEKLDSEIRTMLPIVQKAYSIELGKLTPAGNKCPLFAWALLFTYDIGFAFV